MNSVVMAKIGQVISEIPGQGFGHFKFQTPEEGRPGDPTKIKGINSKSFSKNKCELKKCKRPTPENHRVWREVNEQLGMRINE